MPRSLLAILRGSDGRSLARALALLVLVNVVLAGLHGGVLAASSADGAPVVCALAGGGSAPASPADDQQQHACCLIGCVSSVITAVAPAAPVIADVPLAVATPLPMPPQTGRTIAHLLEAPTGPRGPPVLA